MNKILPENRDGQGDINGLKQGRMENGLLPKLSGMEGTASGAGKGMHNKIDCSEPGGNANEFSYIIIEGTDGVRLLHYDGSDTCVKVPDMIEGFPVVSVGKEAFKDNIALEEVILPDSIEEIEEWAFEGCKNLVYLVCPPKVKELGKGAVDGCCSLRALTFLAQGARYDKEDSRDCGQLKYITVNGKTQGADTNWTKRSKFTIEIVDSHAVIIDYQGLDDDHVIGRTDCYTLYIPELIDGYPVVSVGKESQEYDLKGAFAGLEELIGISVPPSVKKIGIRAFYCCTNLETITLPKSVEKLSESCFRECTSLVSINLQAARLELGYKAFCGCTRLEAAAVWAKEIRVGTDCFADCRQLKTIYFHGRGAVNFLPGAKERLSAIAELVAVPQTGTIEESSFRFHIDQETQTIAIERCQDKTANQKIIIPNFLTGLPVTEIDNGAFQQNNALVNVEIGKMIQEIGERTFKDCKNLRTVVLPEGIKELRTEIFSGCQQLEQITFPSSLQMIWDRAFYNCEELPEVKLPAAVCLIGREAFCGCKGLERILFNRKLSEIGESAFSGCSSLRHILLPAGIRVVRKETFQNCTSLRSVIHQNRECTKEERAFTGCPLESDTIREELPQEIIWQDNLSYRIDTESGEAVLCGCKACDNCKVEIPSYVDGFPVTAIADIAFLCNKAVTSVLIGKNIRVINSMAFYGCENLDEIVFLHQDRGPRIYKEAFYALDRGVIYLSSEQSRSALNADNCTCPVFCMQGVLTQKGITQEVCTQEVYTQGSRMQGGITQGFIIQKGCGVNGICYTYDREKAELLLPVEVKGIPTQMEIAQEAYPWHSIRHKIKTVIMEGQILCVNSSCFADCSSLKKVCFADTVEEIGRGAFKNCRALTDIVLPAKLKYIGEEAFFNCESLTGTKTQPFQLPQSLEKIGKRAFFGCQGFAYLVFPKSVQEIAARAFQRCQKLCEIYMEHEKRPDKIGGKVFYEAAEGCELSIKFTDSSMLEEKFDHKVIIHVPVEGECGKEEKSVFWKLYYDGLLEINGDGEMADYDGITPPWNEYTVQIKRIVIGQGITSVGAMAFHSCNVEKVQLPEGLENIGREAFAHCVNLQDIKIPQSVVNVGRDCFAGCKALKK